jgi:hypothetical protein
MQAETGGGNIVPTNSKPGTRMRWVVSTTLRPLYPRERPSTFVQEPRWALGPFRTVRKLWPQPEFDTRTVHSVASRYTDYAIPVVTTVVIIIIIIIIIIMR